MEQQIRALCRFQKIRRHHGIAADDHRTAFVVEAKTQCRCDRAVVDVESPNLEAIVLEYLS